MWHLLDPSEGEEPKRLKKKGGGKEKEGDNRIYIIS